MGGCAFFNMGKPGKSTAGQCKLYNVHDKCTKGKKNFLLYDMYKGCKGNLNDCKPEALPTAFVSDYAAITTMVHPVFILAGGFLVAASVIYLHTVGRAYFRRGGAKELQAQFDGDTELVSSAV